jgi:anaerobic selenocysteine-containing dehydrogenase
MDTTDTTPKISRRQFIQIGAATLAITVAGGGLFKFLAPRKKEKGDIKASMEKPNKNPAFSSRKKENGSLVCTTRLPDGNILRHELNPVGAEIYLACDGEHNRREIIRNAAKNMGKPPDAFEKDGERFLSELEKQNLIVTRGKIKLFYRTVVRYETT